MAGNPLAQSEFEAFPEKVRATVSANSAAMMTRNVQISWTKPDRFYQIIEFHLSEHVGNGDGDPGNKDRHHPPSSFGPPQYTREQGQVAGKIEIPRCRSFDDDIRRGGLAAPWHGEIERLAFNLSQMRESFVWVQHTNDVLRQLSVAERRLLELDL
jgi:hypothetical protein